MKKYENYVVITDDKGKKQAFYNFHELIKYLDSFKMSRYDQIILHTQYTRNKTTSERAEGII